MISVDIINGLDRRQDRLKMTKQKKQGEWVEQWQMFSDEELFLFKEWIGPADMDTFQEKTVLECGCGGGQHTAFMAPYAKRITAVDLNTVEIALNRNEKNNNVSFVEDDIATMDLKEEFDVVMCIGVIHHTDEPDKSFENIFRHCRKGGVVIVWPYSAEGNALMRYAVEPLRKVFFKNMDRNLLVIMSKVICALIYPAVYTVSRMPSIA